VRKFEVREVVRTPVVEMTKKTLTVLFADLAESVNMYQSQGDIKAHHYVSASLRCMRKVIELQQGTLLRTVGDAILASFDHTDSAYQAAIEIQREHRMLNLSVRVGFHRGNVILDGGDVYGSAVNLAARVAAFSKADEICTTEESIRHMSTELRSNTVYLDRVDFKGISTPIPIYRIPWDDDNTQTAVSPALNYTQRHKSNQVLHLLIGQKQIRIDNANPVVTFGRAHGNDVSINIEPASRNHARIEFSKGRFVIKDHSTNGTYIVSRGHTSQFIRRESMSLENFGCIGLGFSPDDNPQHVIEFSISTVAS